MTIPEILDGVEVLTPAVIGKLLSTQTESTIDGFINLHKEGWNGRLGEHARTLAQLMFVIRTARHT